MLFLDLHDDCIFEILSHLSLAAFPCAVVLCHRIKTIALSNELWERYALRDYAGEMEGTVDWYELYKGYADYSWSPIGDIYTNTPISPELSDRDHVATDLIVFTNDSGSYAFSKKEITGRKIRRWKFTILSCSSSRHQALIFGLVSSRALDCETFWSHSTFGETSGLQLSQCVSHNSGVGLVAGDVIHMVWNPLEETVTFDREPRVGTSVYPVVYQSDQMSMGGYIYCCFNSAGSIRLSRG